MKHIHLFTLLISAVLTCSCSDELNEHSDIGGTYEGIFLRSSPSAKYAPSEVKLTFSSGKFEGKSQLNNYPAICNGTYKVDGGSVEFFNSCVWTAEFDWTFILSGEFSIESSGDTLVLKRTNGSTTDLYQLKRIKAVR